MSEPTPTKRRRADPIQLARLLAVRGEYSRDDVTITLLPSGAIQLREGADDHYIVIERCHLRYLSELLAKWAPPQRKRKAGAGS